MNDIPISSANDRVKTGTAVATINRSYDTLPQPGPFTPALHREMQHAVDHLKAFIGVRSDAHLTFAPKANSEGYFAPNRVVGRNGASVAPHLVNLNPDYFIGQTDEQIASTLAHELIHLWRHENGPPMKRSYHDKMWAAKMVEIGLMPSSTGAPGGKMTGTKMSHYIVADGPFAKSFAELQASGWKLSLESAPRLGSTKAPPSKVKFSCIECGANVWGKPGTEVLCKPCSLESGQPVDMIAESMALDSTQVEG